MSGPPAVFGFVMRVDNAEYPAALEVRKVYVSLGEPDSETMGFIRVIDESGEDYLYPKRFFVALELPNEAAKVVLAPVVRGGAA
jgi:hypothetical protein